MSGLDVRGVVLDLAGLEPERRPLRKNVVGEVLAPERAVVHARLGERAVEVEHADEAGPGAAPVGDGEDGAAVGGEAGEDMMAVLPDRLGDDERRVGGDVAEDFHAVLLAVDEAVLFLLVEGMGALDVVAFAVRWRR